MKEGKMSTQEYNKSYYQTKKEALAARKKIRYETDPVYRERALRAAAEARKAKKPLLPGTVLREIKGTQIKMFRIGAVANFIGRSVNVIRAWEAQGIIPKPLIEGAQRLYTGPQVVILKDLTAKIDSSGNGAGEWQIKQNMKDSIAERWEDGL